MVRWAFVAAVVSQSSAETNLTSGTCSTSSGDCLAQDLSNRPAYSVDDCCNACSQTSGCGAAVFVQGGQYGNTCFLKSSCNPSGSCAGDSCTTVTVGGSPTPSPPSPSGVIEYCPDPATDFNEEVEDGAVGTVTWTDSGWTIRGQRRVSSKASFDFSGGGAEWDMDLSQAHNGINTNFYVTYPYEPNTGKQMYCDSCGNHDYQGRGCAELDWTENNGNCHQATTWHDASDGSECGGYGAEGDLSQNIHCSTQYSGDGSQVTINIGGNSKSGTGHAGELKSRGAVIYSSQWQGWVPGEWCGNSGDLGSAVYTVSNIKLKGKVVQGPEPRRCNAPPSPVPTPPVPSPVPTPAPTPSPSDCPGGSLAACIGMCPTEANAFQACVTVCQERCADTKTCTGGDDGADLRSCVSSCPSDGFQDCVTCCTDKFPSFV